MDESRLKHCLLALALIAMLTAQAASAARAGRSNLPENLAPKATISANSEYSKDYLARFVADGQVPAAGGKQDVGRAWCVKGDTHRNGAELIFVWKEPVSVAEIVYYGRTAWFMNECWKGYEVFLDGAVEPVVKGELKMHHGPQRIKLPRAAKVRTIRLAFTSSYGGFNPGASEIQVFAASPSEKALAGFMKSTGSGVLAKMPRVDEVDCEALRRLIADLAEAHGRKYSRAAQHLARLERLEGEMQSIENANDDPDAGDRLDEVREALARLQREVLLFDVDRLVAIKRHEIVATHVYTYHYEGFQAGGGLYVVSPHEPQKEPVELVASPTGQILECDLSYDGKTILFSWRQTQDEGYHVWTINVDGTGLTQLTDGPWHDYNASWLPDGGIAFLSTRSAQFAYCWHAPVGVVHRMDADGSNVRLLSANYLNDFTPYPLEDGRILYSRWEYVDRPAIPIQSLWTMNPDGTGLSVYFGNRVISPGTFMEARQIPGTTRIICTMTGHNGPTRGAIGVIDRSKGVNAQAAIENITPDVPVPPVDKGNGNTGGTKQYSCPLPLDATRFLVSIRGPLLVRTISGACQSLALPAPENGMQWFNAQPIRPRPRPPVIPASPSSFNEEQKYATVYLQDVYAGLEPYVKRGEVKRVRVVREMQKTVRIDPSMRAFGFQFPVISCGATYAGKTVLGEVPVEPDGSAYFRVPARMPIYFMAIDAQGRAVQRMRSFTHLMPGEVQGCIGCHEPRRQSPPIQRSVANGRPPRDLEPPEWGVGGFDYSRIVQPVLDKHCVECHNPLDAPNGIDLTGGKTDYFNVSYDVLARENWGPKGSPFVSWIPTYNGQEQNILEIRPRAWGSPQSKLAEVLLSGHFDEDGKPRFDMDDKSRRRILAWIDLNVPYYGSSETAYPDKTGCRRIYPQRLDKVLADVAARRCAECHNNGKIPRRVWTRITEPELNNFLVAPLAKAGGGNEKCGKPVFESKDDPDYQAILRTFLPDQEMLAQVPRMDMPGARPAENVSRDCK